VPASAKRAAERHFVQLVAGIVQ